MSKKNQKQMSEQETKETMARLQTQLRVLGVACMTVSDGTIAMFTAEFLRRLADEAERSPDKSALVFMKRFDNE